MLHYGIVAALLGGIFIAFQGAINGMIGNKVGIFTTVIVPVVIQLIILCIALLINRELWTNIIKLREIKFGIGFLIISAILGIGIMSLLTFSVIKSGPLVTFAITVFSQLLAGMIVEHYGIFEVVQKNITGYRVLGLLAMLVGIGLFYK